MPLIDAALAFALTMLVIALTVTQIVRLLCNTAKLRNAELQKMLKEYFEKELQPVIERRMHQLEESSAATLSAKVAAATTAAEQFNLELFDESELQAVIEVSTEELIERLKRCELGKQLMRELGDKAEEVFNELGRRYEAVGEKFTKSFRQHSRRWATGVSLVLAVVVNIDSVHIADSYINDQGLRQSVIAQSDVFMADYNALITSMDAETKTVKSTDAAAPATGTVAPGAPAPGTPDTGKDSVTRQELEQAFDATIKQVDTLTGAGLPIGWSLFPHAGLYDVDARAFQSKNTVGGWVMWILGILLTALLVGLGAPFWYDAVTGIARVAQRARKIQASSGKSSSASAGTSLIT